MSSAVEEALERLGPPQDVYERYGGLVRRGRIARCILPGHENDRTPSMSFYEGKDGKWRWHCHGCQQGGDAIDLARALGERVELKSDRPARSKPKRRKLTGPEQELARALARRGSFPFEFEAAKTLARVHRRAAQQEIIWNWAYIQARGSAAVIYQLSNGFRDALGPRFGIPTSFVYTRDQVELLCEELGR